VSELAPTAIRTAAVLPEAIALSLLGLALGLVPDEFVLAVGESALVLVGTVS